MKAQGIHEPGGGPPGQTCHSCHFYSGVACRLAMHFYTAPPEPFPMVLPWDLPACKSWVAMNDVYLPLKLWDQCLDPDPPDGEPEYSRLPNLAKSDTA